MRAAAIGALACALSLPASGAPLAGADLFTRSDKGYCIACHQLPAGAGPVTRSDLGPRLEGARMRELGRARLRELIVDPTRFNPATIMPPFGRHRILDAAEIDRLVEYLHALP